MLLPGLPAPPASSRISDNTKPCAQAPKGANPTPSRAGLRGNPSRLLSGPDTQEAMLHIAQLVEQGHSHLVPWTGADPTGTKPPTQPQHTSGKRTDTGEPLQPANAGTQQAIAAVEQPSNRHQPQQRSASSEATPTRNLTGPKQVPGAYAHPDRGPSTAGHGGPAAAAGLDNVRVGGNRSA